MPPSPLSSTLRQITLSPLSTNREIYTLADLRDWPTATIGVRPPPRLAVLGDPIAHSASPPMQNAALAARGIAARYIRVHVPPADLPEALALLAPTGFLGANLTLPHKTAALPLLDSLDPHAAALGAVNTVRVEPEGTLHGFNTDGPGFSRAVEAEFKKPLRSFRVLILGAGGGAGRALATQCAIEDCPRLTLVNRTHEKILLLANELRQRTGTKVDTVLWELPALQEVLRGTDLIVNTSSLGLRLDDPSPLPAESIPPRALVFDTVYRRDGAPTPLIAAARSVGASTVTGHSLLLHQGALAFEHWFNQSAPLEVMRAALI